MDGDIRMQLFACLVSELQPNHYSCLVNNSSCLFGISEIITSSSWKRKWWFRSSFQNRIFFFRRSHAHWDSIVLRVILDLPDLLDLPGLQDIMVLRALVDHPVTMVPRDYLDLESVPVFTRLHPAWVWKQIRPLGNKWKWRNQT